MTDLESLHRLLSLEREERESPEVVASIREILSRDNEACRAYVRWTYFEASLSWHLTGDLDGHQEVLRHLKTERRRQQRLLVWGLTSIATVLTIMTGYLTTVVIRKSVPELQIAPMIGWYLPQENLDQHGRPTQPVALLRTGDRLQTRGEHVVIQMSQGATIAWSGLVDLELRSPQEVFLHGGNICVKVPARALGFRVMSPAGTTTDFGTQFGVSVGYDGTTEVHVMQGKVELKSMTQESCPIIAGGARTLDVQGKLGPQRVANESLFSEPLLMLNGVTHVRGDVRFWPQPPRNLTVYTAITDKSIGMFIEQEKYVLPEPLSVYAPQAGSFHSGASPKLIELPAGTICRSYFVHADSSEPVNLHVEFTFDRPILGFLLSESQLNATDRTIGRSDLNYPIHFPVEQQPQYRAFMVSPGAGSGSGDRLAILPDGRSLRLDLALPMNNGRPDVDQLRILVADES